MAARVEPSMEHITALFDAGAASVAALDEVGRGAIAGPVAVGAVLVSPSTPPPPPNVRDSKLLRPPDRAALDPQIRAWAPVAVGFASSGEVDAWSIVGALRLAAHRALAALPPVAVVLLDGSSDWCSTPYQVSLFDPSPPAPLAVVPPVRTLIRGDLHCSAIAAASIVAKVARDAYMAELDDRFPGYGFGRHNGYLSPAHRAALDANGPTSEHRCSFRW